MSRRKSWEGQECEEKAIAKNGKLGVLAEELRVEIINTC